MPPLLRVKVSQFQHVPPLLDPSIPQTRMVYFLYAKELSFIGMILAPCIGPLPPAEAFRLVAVTMYSLMQIDDFPLPDRKALNQID